MTAGLIAAAGWSAAVIAASGVVQLRRARAAAMERIARACHELRGPITATRLGLQLGARTGRLTPVALRALDLELDQAALALDDLAAVTGGTAVRGAQDDVDVCELLADSVEAWRPSADARGVALRLQGPALPARVRGHRPRLAQAAGNLIANALEHGGGAVEVRVRVELGRVRVEVVDGGPGLPAPLAMLAGRARGGRGLRGRGLAIAVAIAQEHGGRIAAAPSERGAKLVLELPALRPPVLEVTGN